MKLKEFGSAEDKYVGDLEKIVEVLAVMKKSKTDPDHPNPMPPDLREGRDKIVEGNFSMIRDYHKDELQDQLKAALNSPKKLRELFEKEAATMKSIYGEFATKLKMKLQIIRQHEAYFARIQRQCGLSKFSMSSQLNGPMIHLTRYFLFLDSLAKLCTKADWSSEEEEFREAARVARDISRTTNNLMLAGKVTHLPEDEDMSRQGNLLHVGTLVHKRSKQGLSLHSAVATVIGEHRLKLFLFKRSLIICHCKRRIGNFQWSGLEASFDEEFKFWIKFSILKLQVKELLMI